MKHQVIAMKKHLGQVELQGHKFKITLPPGCSGMLFVFDTKKAAREYWGKDVELVRIEEMQPTPR